jgi:hypothetical protein
VIERAGVFDSFGRSREVVRGNGWRVFGVLVVLFVISAVASAVLQGIVAAVTDESFLGYALASLIVNALIAPLSALAATVLYVELRRIKGQPLDEDSGAPSPLPPQEGPPPGTHVSERPPEPSDAPPQDGPEAPPR